LVGLEVEAIWSCNLRTVVNYHKKIFFFCLLDDSDHHYESLYSIQQQRAALEGKLEKPLSQQSEFGNGFDKFRDDEDSFDDSDEDDHFDESKPNVDIANVKLPEPPQSTGQVYAFVQRIKNFGSISKNEISKGISKIAKKRASLGKLPSSRSQFYENTQIAEDTPYTPPKYETKSLGKKSRGLAKLQKLGRLTINKLPTNFSLNEDNSEYQTPRVATKENESNSSPNNNLSKSMSNFNIDLSFKSKSRKSSAPTFGSSSTSNIYGSLASKNSTFYVTDSLDVDSGIFAVNEKSTNSPDNSNLNLSSNSNSSINDLKRRSIASITSNSRPIEAPPPPPSEGAPRTRRIGSTSWYAECGLFKNEDIHDEENVSDEKNEKTTRSSWYTESGLYQTSNNSVAR
jgi:neuronal guanine nucleotide exchange factor